jgi:hypothetical protein
MIGSDAVMMYDLNLSLDIAGCGRLRCKDLKLPGSAHSMRFQVTRFWEMETCPSCGRPYGFARADKTLYLGDSRQDALDAFSAAEGALLGYSDAA